MPSAEEFRAELNRTFDRAIAAGQTQVEVISGDLHRRIGGYPPPPGSHHAMPVCCSVMRAAMNPARGDRLLDAPLGGNGATVKIRFVLPRPISS